MGSRPTIRSLAAKAGVSTATVSMALRDSPRIRPEVRRRVQQIAEEEGYRPDPVVANLIAQVRAGKSSRRQSTLGLVLTAENPEDTEKPTVRAWREGCAARAHELGYGLDTFHLIAEGLTPRRLGDILDARGIQGLLVTGPFAHSRIPEDFDPVWQSAATIVMGERPESPALSCVLNNQFSTTLDAVRELLRRGYRRPGLCLHPDLDDISDHRFVGGFLTGQRECPGRKHIPVFAYHPGCREAFLKWASQHRPDVIITLHPEIRPWLEGAGIGVPDEIGLLHFDHTPDLNDWAGIRQNSEQIGKSAVDMLIGQIHRNEFGPPPFQKCMFISGEWVEGDTLRPMPD
jgi:LacI family transcriptional regulator